MSRHDSIAADSAVVEAARRRHATALRSYVAELLPGDRVRVDAVLTETWAALANLPGVEAGPRLAEWIFAEARRRAMAGTRTVVAADEGDAEAGEGPEAIFERLTPKQQEVLHLRLGPEFRVEQIAGIVELAPTHVAQLLHVALGRLAPAFREAGGPASRPARHEDARLTLAALDELDGEQRRAWEEGWTDAAGTLARLEEVRRASRWAAGHLASAQRRRRRSGRVAGSVFRSRRLAAVGVGLVIVAGIGWALWRSEGADETTERREPSVRLAEERESRPVAVTRETTRSDDERPAGKPAGAAASAEVRTLGIFRDAAGRRVEPPSAGMPVSPQDPPLVLRGGGDGAPPPGAGASKVADLAARNAAAKAETNLTEVGNVAVADAKAASSLESVASTDTAAIVALKRALSEGRWPKPEEVDVAKLQAYFSVRARAAARALLFEKRFEAAPAPWAPERILVRAVVQAPDAPPALRPRANVILLLDVSGSMDAPNRLPLVQEAVRGLIDRLRPSDRVGLVTYAGESQVVLAPGELTDPARVRAAVMALEARGRTNGGAGLAEAFALARSDGPAEHLVLLCTDGEFNMGASSEEELAELVRAQARDGVRLAIFGFGRSNQIDPRLEKLAALGGGGRGYVNTRADAVRVLLGQLDELIEPVAREVWLSFLPERDGEPGPPTLARAEAMLPGDTLETMSEVEAADVHARARLDYTLARNGEARTEPWRGRVSPVEFRRASAEFRFAAAVARFGALLRGPREAAAREWDALEAWAREAVDDAGGYRAEFLALVAQARAAR